MDKRNVLGKFKFFTESEPSFQQELIASCSVARLAAGTCYFNEGDICDQFAIVGSGQLRVYKVGENGREITLYHVHAGESCLLNMSCLTAGTPCPATARAETDVEALVFQGTDFRRWMSSSELLRNYAFEMVATRLAGVMELIEEIAFQRMDQRLADYLATQFAEPHGRERSIETTHAQIAADLGSAREVVSRLLKDFEHRGAIQLSRGRIRLQSERVLRSITRD